MNEISNQSFINLLDLNGRERYGVLENINNFFEQLSLKAEN